MDFRVNGLGTCKHVEAVLAWTQRSRQRAWRLKPRGAAHFDARGTACLEGGAILVEGPEATLLDACRQSGELTVELRFVTERVPQTGPARILSFSQDGFQRNWTLAQEGDQLLFRLRTPQTGENGMNPEAALFSVLAGQPTYLVLSYRDGELTPNRRTAVEAHVLGCLRCRAVLRDYAARLAAAGLALGKGQAVELHVIGELATQLAGVSRPKGELQPKSTSIGVGRGARSCTPTPKLLPNPCMRERTPDGYMR